MVRTWSAALAVWLALTAPTLEASAATRDAPSRFSYKFKMTPEEGPLDPTIERRYTPDWASCQKRAQREAENTACFEAEFIRQDAALNRAWKAALRSVPPSEHAALREAQRKWIREREPFCRKVSDSFAGGSIVPVVYADCRVEQTIRRTIWLEWVSGTPPEG